MTSQLIPVFNGTIANETTLLVNARDLHTFLGVGKRFASWITERIEEYGFVENQDYISYFPETGNRLWAREKRLPPYPRYSQRNGDGRA